MEVLLGLAVAVSLGVSDVVGGAAGRRLGPLRTITGVQVVGTLVVAIYLLATMNFLGGAREVLLAAAAGLILALSAVCFYAGLAWGRIVVMSPVTFAAVALLTFTIGLVRGERPSAPAIAGVWLIVLAVVLVSRPPAAAGGAGGTPGSTRRVGLAGELALSVSAGGGFVVFQILLLEIGVDDGPGPLVIVRGVGGVLGLTALAAIHVRSGGGMPRRPRRESIVAVCVAGTLLVFAHALLIEALNRGFLSVVGPITSLTPAFTVLGARIFLHERVSRPQIAGLVLTVVGLVLVALG